MDIIAIIVESEGEPFLRVEGQLITAVTGWYRITDTEIMAAERVDSTDEGMELETKFQSAMREKFEYR